MDRKIVIGYPDQWDAFKERNQLFISRFTNLTNTLDSAFVRKAITSSPADKAILFLGRLCVEDFMEVLCLAANGYGVGAMKLVRGLYERTVTASYLSNHPSEAQAFLDWRFVSRHKALQAYVEAGTHDERWINEAKKAREQYDTIKGKFEVVDCKRCGTKRINNTWNKLDFVSMAKETGDLGILLAQAYYEPLNLAHSTAEAFWLRLTLSEAGDLGFDPGPQPKDADRALQLAHAILIVLLQVQQRHFKMSNLVELINVCVRDFEDIWPGRGLEVDPLKP